MIWMSYAINWDLESIFKGGALSPELSNRLTALKEEIKNYTTLVQQFNEKNNPEALKEILAQQEIISKGMGQCGSFINALMSDDLNDEKAKEKMGELMSLSPLVSAPSTQLMKKLAAIDDTTWEELLEKEPFKEIAFRLNEERRDGNYLLSEGEENLLSHLSLDGLHAWSDHYDTLVSTIEIPFVENGKEVKLSAGQAFNRMMTDPDSAVREELFNKWEQAWGEKAPLFADTLNHLDGFRLTDYKVHGRKHYLDEALEYNRLSKETLDCMWDTIQKK